jgi:hypothetical protein
LLKLFDKFVLAHTVLKSVQKQQNTVKYVVANNILLYRTCNDEIKEAFIQSPFKINDEKERQDETH